MKSELNKPFLLAIYCYCRQAELSVHRSLGYRSELWHEFLDFYDTRKRDAINAIIESPLLIESSLKPNRMTVACSTFISPFLFLCRRIVNPWKSSWSFSPEELAFLHATLATLAKLLNSQVKPPSEELIELRTDLWACTWLLRQRACGLPELAKADNIEHFGQAGFRSWISLDSMHLAPPASSDGAGLAGPAQWGRLG